MTLKEIEDALLNGELKQFPHRIDEFLLGIVNEIKPLVNKVETSVKTDVATTETKTQQFIHTLESDIESYLGGDKVE